MTSDKKWRELWVHPNIYKNETTPWKDNPVKYKAYSLCLDLPGGFWPDKALHVIDVGALDEMRKDWADAEKRLHDKYSAALVERDEANAKIEWLKEKISKLHEDVSSSGTIGVMYGYEQAKDKIESQKQIIEKLKAVLKSIASHYGQRPDDRELARVYEDMAYEALREVEEMEQK
jgi:hypothetical protein